MKYMILAQLWIAWCVLHSLLITPAFTGWVKAGTGRSFRFYRLGYNLFSLITLAPLLYYTHQIQEEPYFRWEGLLMPVRWMLIALSLGLVYAGSRHYDLKAFLGIRQMQEQHDHGLINATGNIHTGGIFGMIRHPFYAAIFPLIWAGNLDNTRLIVNSILSLYTIIGTILEEQKLVSEFGEEYRSYQRQVSMLFPWKWISGKVNKR